MEEDEDAPECVSISSEDTDVAIQKPEVQAILKELAGIKRKEADCYEWLVEAIPRMTDEEVTEVGEKVRPSKLPRCIEDPRNFRTVLAVGERIFSIYKHEQTGELVAEVSELCEIYDIGKTKLYEVLRGGKYRRRYPPPNQKASSQLGGLQPSSSGKQRKHLEGRVEARSPPKIQFVSELNKNSGPYGTTNSSQRKYKLKS